MDPIRFIRCNGAAAWPRWFQASDSEERSFQWRLTGRVAYQEYWLFGFGLRLMLEEMRRGSFVPDRRWRRAKMADLPLLPSCAPS